MDLNTNQELANGIYIVLDLVHTHAFDEDFH
jgi:hypothetical protein